MEKLLSVLERHTNGLLERHEVMVNESELRALVAEAIGEMQRLDFYDDFGYCLHRFREEADESGFASTELEGALKVIAGVLRERECLAKAR